MRIVERMWIASRRLYRIFSHIGYATQYPYRINTTVDAGTHVALIAICTKWIL